MTITRQDLEDAAKAKAAGSEIDWCFGDPYVEDRIWNPAANTADAFDLAMKCGMWIDFELGICWSVSGQTRHEFTPGNMTECCEAIVLAAAEMWRSREK